MPPVPHPGTPISIPLVAHLVMWPALIGWTVLLGRLQRSRSWPCSPRLGAALVPGCLFLDAGVLLAALRWPSTASNSFILALLWLGALFSVTAFFALRTRRDGGGGGEPEDRPEPPWWPDFERQFRDYTRRGPRKPVRPPKPPADRLKAPAGAPSQPAVETSASTTTCR